MSLHLSVSHSVILFTGGGRHVPLGRHPTGQTPPTQTPAWAHPLGTHLPGHTPYPLPHKMATAADGTHPTGMHSCDLIVVAVLVIVIGFFWGRGLKASLN